MDNHLLVIFGASGDLTRRKLIPALFELYAQKLLPARFAILGVSRTQYSDEQYRLIVKKALSEHLNSEGSIKKTGNFMQLTHYLSVETSDSGSYDHVRDRIHLLDEKYRLNGNCIFYLATPPDLYQTVSRNLSLAGLSVSTTAWRRIIIEKPFGYNLESARHLNRQLLKCFTEEQIYRIDHYLGKESVQNVMVTRFSNGIFEPLWNRNYVNHVEITSAENLGVGTRGGYYDRAGALRDMIQNHLLQLLTLVAMEPPTRITSHAIRNETLKVLQSVRPFSKRDVKGHVIRGQYTEAAVRGEKVAAYRSEPGISGDSRTETYVALRLYIDNWRWGNVPFYIRTGKRMPTRVTEIVVHFRPSPHTLFCFSRERYNSDNQLVIRIQPDEGILLKFGMKVPGVGFNVQEVNMDFHYSELGEVQIREAYQRLLLDCMQGDSTLFTRGDAVEQSWDIIEPILKVWENDPATPLYGYPSGTWGPKEAESLIAEHGLAWRYPCRNLTDDGIYCAL
ncbi:MAG: glucose-6-phosphate dehydrogenase [Bacteroidales bacterium]|nr:glucose-6-phosphate dehydrogenase [Bacteroidales bacterium]